MALLARRLESVDRRVESFESVFGIQAAGRLLAEAMSPWVQQLGILVEAIESGRPAGAPPDWQPGAVLRLPFSNQVCHDGRLMCPQALLALADTAMTFACAAACNGNRSMSPVDQTIHFLRPVSFDVLADARIVRIGRSNIFGRVTLSSSVDRRQVGMVSSAYAIL